MKKLAKLLNESTESEKKRAADVVSFLEALAGHNYSQGDKAVLKDAANIVRDFIQRIWGRP